VTAGHSVSVIVPAYNESATIESVIRGIDHVLARWPGFHEIIVIDDGSRDRTGEIAKDLARELPSLRVVQLPENRGYGAAQQTGLAHARGELVCLLPADGQIPPSALDEYLRAAPAADVVIGAYRARADSIARRLSSGIYRTVVRLLFGVRVRTINAPKLYRRAHLAELPLSSTGGFADAEIVIQLHARGRTFKEVEIDCLPRKAGRSSVGWGAALYAVLELVRFWRSGRYRGNGGDGGNGQHGGPEKRSS
jgi:glycosyltransferase involved in cell wall biosynthesis